MGRRAAKDISRYKAMYDAVQAGKKVTLMTNDGFIKVEAKFKRMGLPIKAAPVPGGGVKLLKTKNNVTNNI